MRGMVYGKLTILENGKSGKKHQLKVKCQCDCGNITYVEKQKLVNGGTRSCGCLRGVVHGYSHHYLYRCWKNIKERCFTPHNRGYKSYGGRGITLYRPWIDDPKAFITHVVDTLGNRPKGMSLDRIDNDGNYEPGNLRWGTRKVQRGNQRERPVGESGLRWVYPRKGKFAGWFVHEGETYRCGSFSNPEEAFQAVIARREEMGLPMPPGG